MSHHDSIHRARRVWSGASLCAAIAALAAVGATAAMAQSLPTVDVHGAPAAIDAQTRSYGREELERYGEDTLSDILRRLPGITLDAEGRVLLRGMGGGYTQVLLNGRPLSLQGNGAILDGLGAEVIERIEIVRGTTASDSVEGVAGTVRIITREAHGERIRRARVEGGRTQGGSTGTVALELGDRVGDVDWLVSGRWRNQHNDVHRLTESVGSAADGSTYYVDRTHLQTAERRREFTTNGSIAWRASAQDQVTLQWLGELGASRKHTPGVLDQDAPWPAQYATSLTRDDEPRFWHLEPGDFVLFHAAAGGVGLIACQWARALGLRLIGTAGSDAKCQLALDNGAAHAINYAREDFAAQVKEITGGRGVKVVYDSVGKDTWDKSLECLRPFGLMASFGNASGPVPPFAPGSLGAKGSLYVTRQTLFTHISSREATQAMADDLFKVVESGEVRIHIDQRYPLADVQQAHRDLEARKTTGCTILTLP